MSSWDGRLAATTRFGAMVRNGLQVPPRFEERLVELVAGGQRMGWDVRTRADATERYDPSGRLLSITYRDGLKTSLSYDPKGRLTHVDGPQGHRLTFQYNAVNRIIGMTDPSARVYGYTYDGNDNLTSVTYPDGRTRTYHYEEGDLGLVNGLTGVTDENGARFATYSYREAADAGGRSPSRPVSSTHALGADSYSISYSSTVFAGWGSASVMDPRGTTRTYSFGTFAGARRAVAIGGAPCPSCGAQSTTYSANGFVESVTDWNGRRTTYLREDPYGRLDLETTRTEAAGTAVARTVKTEWHSQYRLPIKITEPGLETSYSWDDRGNLTAKVVKDTATNATRTWGYVNTYSESVPGRFEKGQLLRIEINGPRADVSDVTTYTYYPAEDAEAGRRGMLATRTDALGHVTEISAYDAHGKPLRVVDPNGLVTALTYDIRQRLVARDVGGELTAYEYDAPGQLTQTTLPDGSSLRFSYDAAHRLTGVSDAAGNRIVYTLERHGQARQGRHPGPERGAGAHAGTRVRRARSPGQGHRRQRPGGADHRLSVRPRRQPDPDHRSARAHHRHGL